MLSSDGNVCGVACEVLEACGAAVGCGAAGASGAIGTGGCGGTGGRGGTTGRVEAKSGGAGGAMSGGAGGLGGAGAAGGAGVVACAFACVVIVVAHSRAVMKMRAVEDRVFISWSLFCPLATVENTRCTQGMFRTEARRRAMRSIPVRVVVAIVVLGSGWWCAQRGPSTVSADEMVVTSGRADAAQFGNGGAYCTASVPREWGTYRTGSQQSGLSFEAADGTLRFITNLPCDGSTPQVALQIRRVSAAANQ